MVSGAAGDLSGRSAKIITEDKVASQLARAVVGVVAGAVSGSILGYNTAGITCEDSHHLFMTCSFFKICLSCICI